MLDLMIMDSYSDSVTILDTSLHLMSRHMSCRQPGIGGWVGKFFQYCLVYIRCLFADVAAGRSATCMVLARVRSGLMTWCVTDKKRH